jgi:ribonuclease E
LAAALDELPQVDAPVELSAVNSNDGWEPVPEAQEHVIAPQVAVAPKPQREEVTVAAMPVASVSKDGVTAGGRAMNDPRIAARPVGVVEIATSHKPLFGAIVAPAAKHSGRVVPRASNDPRGARPQAMLAQAGGQS